MKKLISLCALAALYAGPVLAESPAVKTDAATTPPKASVEKAKEENAADKKVEKKEVDKKEVAATSEESAAKGAEPTKAAGEKPVEHTEHKETK
ncbi:MAG: hypothetical protein U0136_14060 [Bdellovibrionota bacterium]